MYKPFNDIINDARIVDSTSSMMTGIEIVPNTNALSFDLEQFYLPDFSVDRQPIVAQRNFDQILIEAAITASINNGHVFIASSDGCACCGHDHGLEHKQAIASLSENLKAAFEAGLVTQRLDSIAEFLSDSLSVSSELIIETFKANLDTLSAETTTKLYMDSVPGNSSTTASVQVDGSVSGTRETGTDADWYRVDLEAGQTYTFIMLRDGNNPHEDPLLKLISTDGVAVLVENDDLDTDGDGVGNNQNSLITYTVPMGQGGTYYLSAEGFGDSTGDYTIYVEPGNDRPDFTLDQSAYFLTHQFATPSAWGGDLVISYDVSALSAGAQTLALNAMAAWAEVSGLTFVQHTATTGVADIRFQDTEEGAYAQTFDTNGVIYRSVVNVNAQWDGGNTDLNSYAYQTYLHEVGHALGLGHGGPYNGFGNYASDRAYNQDAWNYTVMSYFDQGEANNGTPRLVLGLQLVDLIAIQSLYGSNTGGTRTSDTVYGFNVTADIINSVFDFENSFDDEGIRPPSISIYDTGGVDTLDFSGWSTLQIINLNQETFSSIGDNYVRTGVDPDGNDINPIDDPLVNNISIARGTVIENAIGGSGNDQLIGNEVDNELTGGLGDDIINGGDGDDVAIYSGNQASYTITENSDGTWTISGADGTDTLTDVEYARFADGEVLLGAPPGPTFTENADMLDGTENDDTLNALGGNDVVNGLGGNDTINGMGGDDTLSGNLGNDIISGGDGDDTLYGNDGVDTINGDAGFDTLYGGSGNDTLDGGALNDTLYGGDGDDTLRGGTQNDTLYGDAGVDELHGDVGNDMLHGGAGNDELHGGANNDFLYGDANNDTLRGGDGTDWLFGGTQNDTLYGDAGTDELNGEDGNDTLYGGTDNDELNGGTGNDFLYGEAGSDTLNGGDGIDWLFGGTQNDILDGGLGADEMTGGSGNDTYYVDNVGDDVIELAGAGSGYDIVNVTLNTYLLTVGDNIERVNFQGTGNFVTRGNEGDNRFTGAAGNDRFILDAGGSDIFSGGTGRDAFDARSSTNGITIRLDDQSLHAGDAAGDTFASIESFFGSNTAGDYMVTGAARARFSGFGGDDTLIGGNSVDFLQGGADNDTLDGGAARDTLQGGTGNDMMTGGSDRDQFLFVETAFGQDTILDYEDGLDYLRVFSTVADDISDFIITGNGTSTVTLTLDDGTGNNTITLMSHDGSNIDITAADFQFY